MAVPQLPNRLLTVVFVCLEQYGIIAVVLAGLTAYRAFFNPETSVWQVSVLEKRASPVCNNGLLCQFCFW